jgi:hypothetical protein
MLVEFMHTQVVKAIQLAQFIIFSYDEVTTNEN